MAPRLEATPTPGSTPRPGPKTKAPRAHASPRGRHTQLAETCPVTGLPRGEPARRALAAEIAALVKGGDPAALALVDVDEFHDVNRTLGAERADAVLKAVAKRVLAALPPSAHAARLAGDCVIVLLPHTQPEQALIAMQEVRAAVSRSPIVAGKAAARREAHVTVSVGVAGAPRDGASLELLLGPAQAALRRAKTLGRDRVASPPGDRMTMKTSYYESTQLERLKLLAQRQNVGEATILREALEDVLLKYKDRRPS